MLVSRYIVNVCSYVKILISWGSTVHVFGLQGIQIASAQEGFSKLCIIKKKKKSHMALNRLSNETDWQSVWLGRIRDQGWYFCTFSMVCQDWLLRSTINIKILTLSSIITRSRGSVRSIFRTRCLVWALLLPTRKYLWWQEEKRKIEKD